MLSKVVLTRTLKKKSLLNNQILVSCDLLKLQYKSGNTNQSLKNFFFKKNQTICVEPRFDFAFNINIYPFHNDLYSVYYMIFIWIWPVANFTSCPFLPWPILTMVTLFQKCFNSLVYYHFSWNYCISCLVKLHFSYSELISFELLN